GAISNWASISQPPGGSADLDIPEAITLRSAVAQVHLTLGAALVYASIAAAIISLKRRSRTGAGVGGCLVSLVAIVHPFDVVVVAIVAAATFASWPLIEGRGSAAQRSPFGNAFRLAAWFGVASLPVLAYLLFLYLASDVGREWSRVISALSPPPIQYLIGFGLVALFASAGFWLLWRGRRAPGRIFVAWAVIQAALLYAPFSFQRRLVEGLQLPLSIAASVAIFWTVNRLSAGGRSKWLRRSVLLAVIAAASLTNLGFIVGETALITPADPRR